MEVRDFQSSDIFQDNTITGGQVHIGHSYTVYNQNPSVELRNQFLGSLRFNEVGWRSSQIDDAFPRTFEWIFSDRGSPWDDFAKWLRGDGQWYWINGKPGSGKSTLMKFLVWDRRTRECLQSNDGTPEPLIMSFFFWLAGTEDQRTLRGCLSSLLLQLCESNDDIVKMLLGQNTALINKRNLGDWSKRELLDNILITLTASKRRVCLFLDGLDEFDTEKEDVEDLFDALESICSCKMPESGTDIVKICTSSRTEPSFQIQLSKQPQLRLQDLNESDIRLLITDKLNEFMKKNSMMGKKKDLIETITGILTQRAEGVFLWVHLALKSVFRGLRNNDDLTLLLKRLTELPTGMHQLYQQMWQRLNHDEKLYSKESALYFSFAKDLPLNLLRFTFATNDSLRNRYFEAQDIDHSFLQEAVEACETAIVKVHSRSAGLLEVTPEDPLDSDYYSHHLHWSANGHTVSSQCSEMMNMLKSFQNSEIQFIHRTAEDFLFQTTPGQLIRGKRTPDDLENDAVNNFYGLLAGVCFGFDCVTPRYLQSLFLFPKRVGDTDIKISKIRRLDTVMAHHFQKWHSATDSANWPELLALQPFGRSVSSLSNFKEDYLLTIIGNPAIDLTSLTALCGCCDALKDFVNSQGQSPYYQGYLIICLTDSIFTLHLVPGQFLSVLRCIIWLTHRGADLYLKHPLMQVENSNVHYFLASPLECAVLAFQKVVNSSASLWSEAELSEIVDFMMFLRRLNVEHTTLVRLSTYQRDLSLIVDYHNWVEESILIEAALTDILDALILKTSRSVSSKPECNDTKLFTKSRVKFILGNDEVFTRYRPSGSESTHILDLLAASYTKPTHDENTFDDLSSQARREIFSFSRKLLVKGRIASTMEIFFLSGCFLVGQTDDQTQIPLLPLNPTKDIGAHNWMDEGSLRLWSEKKNQGKVDDWMNKHYLPLCKALSIHDPKTISDVFVPEITIDDIKD